MGKTNERLKPGCNGAVLLEGKVLNGSVAKDELAAWIEGFNL